MTVTTDDAANGPAGEPLPDLSPEDIGPDFAPKPRDSVSSSRFDNEVLLVDGDTGRIHVLNSTAAIVWECFDGEVTLEELAAELADAFRAPLETVQADTFAMTRELGRLRLLDGVSLPAPEAGTVAGPLEVGELVEAFDVVSAGGDEISLPRPGSEGTLLVNWSPFCGYCGKIAADLAQCRPALAERGIDLVLLTAGSFEDNQGMLGSSELNDAAFVRRPADDAATETISDPFGAMGTPVAYLLDSTGRVTKPLAYGADQVPKLAREAAGLPATEVSDASSSSADGSEGSEEQSGAPVRRLPAASGVCGPSPSGSAKKSRQWAVTSTYAIGDYRVGIRANSLATDELLAKAFAPYRIDEPTPAADNFSVVVGDDGKPGAKALNLLLMADTTVVRSRSPGRVIRALGGRLSSLLDGEDDGMLRTRNVAALVGEDAILLPRATLYWLEYLQPRLSRLGIRLSDEPHALIDPVTRELVIPDHLVGAKEAVLAGLDDPGPLRTELPPMEPGRYSLRAWTIEEEVVGSPTPTTANAVAAILAAVVGTLEQLGDVIAAVSQVLTTTEAVPLRSSSQHDLISSIEERLVNSPLRIR
jgi:hypothetical protein